MNNLPKSVLSVSTLSKGLCVVVTSCVFVSCSFIPVKTKTYLFGAPVGALVNTNTSDAIDSVERLKNAEAREAKEREAKALAIETFETQTNNRLPYVDVQKKPSFFEQYKLGGFGLGSWINHGKGDVFKPIAHTSKETAILYLYRPDSKWNAEEIIAPSIFLNGQRLHSLRNNHYYYVEVPAGQYRLLAQRPLAVAYIKKPEGGNIQLKAGETYYVRYDEQFLFGNENPALGLFGDGALQQMTASNALKEIVYTKSYTSGYRFVPSGDAVEDDFKLKNFNQAKYRPVPKSRLQPKKEVVLNTVFKWFNPLTW